MKRIWICGFVLAAPLPAAADEVTFNGRIAPLVHQKCAGCHRPGQVGPFPLLTYADVSKRAETIRGVIEDRYMPPWKAVGHEVAYADDRRLSDEQIALFGAWVDAGKPEGDPASAPVLPDFPKDWALGEPDLVVSMDAGFEVPAEGRDIYRSFVFKLDLKEDKWVKAVELRPTAKGAMHHALFFLDSTGAARRMDGRDGKPGFGGMIPPTGGLGGYVPGTTPTALPEDLAMRLPAGSDIVMQTHFHPSGKAQTEKATLALYLTDTPPSRTLVGLQVPPRFGLGKLGTIRKGDASHTVIDTFTIPVDSQAWSVGGHAHYICREMDMVATLPDGTTKSLLRIDDWDLDWQDRYTFDGPIDLPAGTMLKTTLVYDNSAANPRNPFSPPRDIRWGRESNDEMGSVTLVVTAKQKADEPALLRAAGRNLSPLGGNGEGRLGGGLGQLATPEATMRLLDRNRDGRLQRDELPERLRNAFPLLDLDGDGSIDMEELKSALERFRR